MKSKFTLTKTFALAILLVCFTAVSASTLENDSCKTKCCKNKKVKAVAKTTVDFNKALKEINAEIRYVTTIGIAKEIKNTLRTIRLEKIAFYSEMPSILFEFDIVEENNKVDAKHKIDFTALDKEMNQVQEELSKFDGNTTTSKIDFSALDKEMNNAQEELSKMDDSLKNDDAKTRKAAEEILKTGIKS